PPTKGSPVTAGVSGVERVDPARAGDPEKRLGRLNFLLPRRYTGGEAVREELPGQVRQPAGLRSVGGLFDDAPVARQFRQGEIGRGTGCDQGDGRDTARRRRRTDAA